ncbi:MAG: MoaD/ThiS family protein [Candidatus Nitrosopelagicus sp.]|nr:MoaD/ThiS family protein [Candidatus Nitrosopelagicus sp.]|tara:strand:- start:301 stop:1071 length:771 start_codon:yes stop_codon:yes gene_type:complete
MITVNFTGGARKSFRTDSLEISQNLNTISELITYLITQKPKNTPDFDGKNLLIAINGVDTSALNGNNTTLNSDDVVNIIPIIHGGSKTNVSFNINNHQIGLFEINKSNSNKEYLLSLRKKLPRLQLQAISSKFILDKEHAKKIISISINKKLKNQLLSNKLEIDLLLRFSNTTQIDVAIKNIGLSQTQNFILIAIGNKSHQTKLSEIIHDNLDIIFKNNNHNFLKKHFQISTQTLNSIESLTPLTDLLVEKASILI